jgi:CheY-like chemotaxis protein
VRGDHLVSDEAASTLLLRAEVRHGGGRFVTHTLDVSPTAVVLACDSLAVGSEAEIRLSLPGLVEAFDLAVRVRSTHGARGHGEPAAAVCEIRSAEAKVRQTLASLVMRGPGAADPPSEPPSYRCLLVEDNALIRDLFAYGLGRYGRSRRAHVSLEVASDAESAWEILRGERYDMAIVDHYLPVLSGAELIARVRADPSLTRMLIVAISVGGAEAREAAMVAGADMFLDKPVVLRDLFSTIDRLTGRHAA